MEADPGERRIEALEAQNRELGAENQQLKADHEQLRQLIEQLQQRLEQLQRQAARQAAPFRRQDKDRKPLPIYRTSTRHRTQMAHSIQARTTSAAVNGAYLPGPRSQSGANPASDASGTTIRRPFPRSVNPCPARIINVSLDREGSGLRLFRPATNNSTHSGINSQTLCPGAAGLTSS